MCSVPPLLGMVLGWAHTVRLPVLRSMLTKTDVDTSPTLLHARPVSKTRAAALPLLQPSSAASPSSP